jgi:hypothetical protein
MQEEELTKLEARIPEELTKMERGNRLLIAKQLELDRVARIHADHSLHVIEFTKAGGHVWARFAGFFSPTAPLAPHRDMPSECFAVWA